LGVHTISSRAPSASSGISPLSRVMDLQKVHQEAEDDYVPAWG
jgi:hypothetical protein